MITKPTLAVAVKDFEKIKYPVLATPKLDGIRCLKIEGKALSRNFKPIPNKQIREMIEYYFPDNVDGEIIIPNKSFNEISSIVMTEDEGLHNFKYCVFDYVLNDLNESYEKRILNIAKLCNETKLYSDFAKCFVPVLPLKINNIKELEKYEKECLEKNYEGIMIRSPKGPYKCGRSTEREGYLLKIKRFTDSEARIIGFEEKMHNNNEAKKDVFGHTERSSHKANKKPANTLGNILVIDLKTKLEFSIGTGFNDELKKEIWDNQGKYINKIVKYKYLKSGMKELPRSPVFLGLRDKRDMS